MRKVFLAFLVSFFIFTLVHLAIARERAKEITNPDGYINVPRISLAELAGKKIVLLDFWTYSCINCVRTIPYLNAWYDKYKDYGFTIIGIHTPEFEFEKKYDNVLAAVKKFQIKYPVVLNNNHSTWNAYGDLYWPREALIDVDGNIFFRHVGEGNYDETERQIQAALALRAKKLGLKLALPGGIAEPKLPDTVDFGRMQSPEIYFGSSRNEYLGSGRRFAGGTQTLSEPKQVEMNKLYLAGDWDFKGEFATSQSKNAKIIFHYGAKNVYLVASAKEKIKLIIKRDGKPLGKEAGEDVSNGVVTVSEERLYKLIKDPAGYGMHTIEITIEKPGLSAFTFTFG